MQKFFLQNEHQSLLVEEKVDKGACNFLVSVLFFCF